MPVKKDDAGRRWVEMEFVTPGTPEQVWQAMATGPGNTAWFTPTTIEERVGGALEFTFGGYGTQAGEVTTWEPPHRFGYVERDWSKGAPPVATEITITARSGDRCVVRMVHSLFSSSDEWDDQMESFEKGWPGFFEVLRLYLTHSPGRRGASFTAMTRADGEHLAIWKRLLEALDLTGADAGEGRSTPDVPEVLSGSVEHIDQRHDQRHLVMRLNSPAPGVAIVASHGASPRVHVSVTVFFHGEDADERVAHSEPRWRTWISGRFGSPDREGTTG